METKAPLHIFIVENNNLFVRLLDYVFSKSIIYRFLDFKTGEDALKNLALHPQLVILDYTLPGMNGFDTLLEIREQDPRAHVIILLNEDDRRLPAEFLNAGAADYVIKNGNEEAAIVEKIESFLAREKVFKEIQKLQNKPSMRKKIYYAVLILIILSIGFYYYQ